MTDGIEGSGLREPGVRWKNRLKKLGWIGFLLFLLKGIVWLAVGYLLLK